MTHSARDAGRPAQVPIRNSNRASNGARRATDWYHGKQFRYHNPMAYATSGPAKAPNSGGHIEIPVCMNWLRALGIGGPVALGWISTALRKHAQAHQDRLPQTESHPGNRVAMSPSGSQQLPSWRRLSCHGAFRDGPWASPGSQLDSQGCSLQLGQLKTQCSGWGAGKWLRLGRCLSRPGVGPETRPQAWPDDLLAATEWETCSRGGSGISECAEVGRAVFKRRTLPDLSIQAE